MPVRKIRKLSTVKVTAPVAIPSPVVEAAPRKSAERFTHSMEFAYSGDSPVVTSRKSKTPLRIDEFGTTTNLVLSDRDHACMDPLRKKFGNKAFQRGDLDAGILNRLIRKGVLSFVSGEASSDRAMLRFVK